MNRQTWKQLLVYGLALAASRVSLVGCYPLVPGIFAAGLLVEVNRPLLLIFSLFGMAVFLPLAAMVKYAVAVVVTWVAIGLVEWAAKGCKTWLGAVLASVITVSVTWAGEVLQLKNRTSLWMGILEGAFLYGFVLAAVPLLHWFLEGMGQKEASPAGRIQVGKSFGSYSEALGGLSRSFSQMSLKKEEFRQEEITRMQQEITGKICVSCDQCALCWEQENSPMYRSFYRLLSSIEKIGIPRQQEQEEFAAYCAYPQVIIQEALEVFERARLNLAWYNRLLENREVIAQQLDAMAAVLEDCTREYVDISKQEGKLVAAVRYQLREQGGKVSEAHLYEKPNHRWSLTVSLCSRWGNCIPVKELTKAVSTGLRRDMIPARHSKTLIGKEESVLTFEEQPKFYTLQGVARVPREGSQVSGDNFSFLELEDGETVLTLSDGMGTGIRACKESEMVIELIERFLETGFHKDTAIQMMNAAMVLQGEDGMFSTVDMASIDKYTGICQFTKIGAATTFVKRGHKMEAISGASLPAGIYPQVEMEEDTRALRDGDFVILVSDGVLDYLPVEKPEEAIKEILETIESNNPEKLAEQLLEQVLTLNGGCAQDDMTVLAAGIWER